MRVLLIRLLRPAVFIPIIIFKNLKAILSPSLPSAISLRSSMLEVRREPRGPSFPPTISNIFPLDSNLSSFEFFSSVISLPSLIVALMAPSFPGRPVVTCSNPSTLSRKESPPITFLNPSEAVVILSSTSDCKPEVAVSMIPKSILGRSLSPKASSVGVFAIFLVVVSSWANATDVDRSAAAPTASVTFFS